MGSKQGIILEEHRVLKRHPSIESADLERTIAGLYSGNAYFPIRTPHYFAPEIRDSVVYLPMERIKTKNLMHNADPSITKILVRDLALFHHMFSQHPIPGTSNVLYRDSIPSNYIITPENHIVHIDFSSSDRFVHAWDDVALLLNPAWSTISDPNRERLIEEYIRLREQFSTTPRFTEQLPRAPDNQTEEQRRVYYVETTKRMLATGFTQVALLGKFDVVDFRTLRREDYRVFDEFRTLRANFYKQKIWGNQ
ncbi:MAG: hypothetical protein Q8R18_04960 [bacterium]|nr:hypothetical protein [bacterium]